ncbi:solute carrier family 26 member 10-like isoform X2 [Paramacrobiotus metropolitanus]|nr:solute carrier family 26 member 10-like isoform X2 [Paramacrobiotus metropolitanus]
MPQLDNLGYSGTISAASSAYQRRSNAGNLRKSIVLRRPIFSQDKFDSSQEFGEHGTPTSPWDKLKRYISHQAYKVQHWQPNVFRLLVRFFVNTFPILKWLPKYNVRQDLLQDSIAGFTVGVMNIPQGMAYGLLAALPAVYGLYTSFFPALLYTVMCTSRHVSFGTFAIASIMTSKVVQRYALAGSNSELLHSITSNMTQLQTVEVTNPGDLDANLELRITVLVALTVTVGIWQLIMGILGLGYLSIYLSDQLVKGFTTGAAFHVFTSQLRSIFGLRKLKEYSGALKLVYAYIDFFKLIKETHIPTLVISIICLVILLSAKFLINENNWIQSRLPVKIPFPSELVVVVFGALASYLMSLGTAYGVDILGHIPLGLPAPRLPDLSILPAFALDSFAIAIVSFAITLSLTKLFSNKYKYSIDANQELRAMGFSNIFAGFFQCIPSTGSLGRTAVQTSIGGKTQIVSVISTVFVLIVLLALGRLLEPLPKACLGCVIVVALIGLLKQIMELRKLSRVSAIDTSVFVVTLGGVLLTDIDLGLGIAVGWSLLTVVFRTQRPDVSVLGRALGTEIYKRIDVYKSAVEVPGCKIIRFEAPLYFANCEYFLDKIHHSAKLGKYRARPSKREARSRQGSTASYKGFVESGSTNDHDIEMHTVSHATTLYDNHPSQDIQYTPFSAPERGGRVDAATLTMDLAPVEPLTHLIVDCSSVCFVDVNGIAAINQLAAECSDAKISLFLASCKANMRESLALSGFTPQLNVDHIFVSIHDAIMQAVQEHA